MVFHLITTFSDLEDGPISVQGKIFYNLIQRRSQNFLTNIGIGLWPCKMLSIIHIQQPSLLTFPKLCAVEGTRKEEPLWSARVVRLKLQQTQASHFRKRKPLNSVDSNWLRNPQNMDPVL